MAKKTSISDLMQQKKEAEQALEIQTNEMLIELGLATMAMYKLGLLDLDESTMSICDELDMVLPAKALKAYEKRFKPQKTSDVSKPEK